MLRTGNTSQRNAYVIGIVALASLLISLHHRLEKWIKEKMTGKKKNDWQVLKKRLRSWRKNNILYRILRFAIFYLF
jgi:hypothetical protein